MTLPGEALEPTVYAGFCSLIRACDFRAVFGGGIPTESWSFSSEKSYSPSKLTCSHEMAEWLATASRISALSSSVDAWSRRCWRSRYTGQRQKLGFFKWLRVP